MISFNQPVHLGTELDVMAEAILRNGHVAGGGPFGRRCESLLERLLGQRTLLVTSGTHALELAGLLLDLQPGDEVIVPSYTFVSTANAFALRGARPVFADVDEQGLLSLAEVERLLSPSTRAVVPVHYAGVACELPRLLELCGRVPVIEDAAQAIGASLGGRPLGTFGAVAALSFHETKNVGCGEGGALTLRDPALIERAEVLRDKGTNRKQFQEGLVDKYSWVDLGSSYALSDLNAAYLSTQLEHLERIQARRRALHERYCAELSGPAERAGAAVLSGAREGGNHHLFALVLRSREQRTRFIAGMAARGITAPFHYVALHQSPMGARFHDGRPLPQSERLSDCLVRLPLFFNLRDEQQAQVIEVAAGLLDAA